MGACPVRAAKSENSESSKAKQIDEQYEKPTVLPKRGTNRFEKTGLSGDAAEFNPAAATHTLSRRSGAAATHTPLPRSQRQQRNVQPAPVIDPREPEWAQFLAKKAGLRNQYKGNGRGASNRGPINPPAVEEKPATFDLDTSGYLQLLKTGEKSSHQSAQAKGLTPANPGSPDKLKVDLAGALDSIIRQHRQDGLGTKGKKPRQSPLKRVIMQERSERGTGPQGQDNSLWRIVQMLDPRDEVAGEDAVVQITAQDDIMMERENKDQDLAELAYWSDDDKAPKAIHRASAHKVGDRNLNNCVIREYVTQNITKELDSQVATLLLHLRKLNDRHRTIEPNPTGGPMKRNYVIGIKEVFRGVRQGRVKCVIIAPDIEEIASAGGLDDRIRDILRVAYEKDVPVIFALSRIRIGRALGKTLRMSVIAVHDTTGVNELYDSVADLSYNLRLEWLSKAPK